MRPDTHQITRDYHEEHVLPGGGRYRVRMVRPDDKQRLLDGFERLSPESRYRRFLTSKDGLTDAELRYFTEVDGVDHVALAAVEMDSEGREGPGIGVARFVRLPDQSASAELAVAVVDEYQNKGIGRLLLRRLITAAAERGIKTIRGHVLAENEPMLTLLEHYAVSMQPSGEGSLVTCEFPIDERPPILQAAFDLFRHIASGVLRAEPFDQDLAAVLKRDGDER